MINESIHGNRRKFTCYEDTLIIRQSKGEFTLAHLLCQLHSTREAVTRRARELGVELRIRPKNSRAVLLARMEAAEAAVVNGAPILTVNEGEAAPLHYDDDEAYSVDSGGAAFELKRLQRAHPDRQYPQVKFKKYATA